MDITEIHRPRGGVPDADGDFGNRHGEIVLDGIDVGSGQEEDVGVLLRAVLIIDGDGTATDEDRQ